jgi:hypothetical protein
MNRTTSRKAALIFQHTFILNTHSRRPWTRELTSTSSRAIVCRMSQKQDSLPPESANQVTVGSGPVLQKTQDHPKKFQRSMVLTISCLDKRLLLRRSTPSAAPQSYRRYPHLDCTVKLLTKPGKRFLFWRHMREMRRSCRRRTNPEGLSMSTRKSLHNMKRRRLAASASCRSFER